MIERLADLPEPQRSIIEMATSIGRDTDTLPHLVGGGVRDLYLRQPFTDIDFTLPARADDFATVMAERLGGRIHRFPRFLTRKVVLEGFPAIDIAETRGERYEKPGALPDVFPSTLDDDLRRRDFSINAIAIDLVKRGIVDPTGGVDDLRDRTVRVLHDASFVDDPTRMLRGIRLAVRLDFHLDANTSALMTEAVKNGALETVSAERLWREVGFAIDERRAGLTLARFADAGILGPLLGVVSSSKETAKLLEKVDSVIELWPDADRRITYLLAFARARHELRVGTAPLTDREKRLLSSGRERVDALLRDIGGSEDPTLISICSEADDALLLHASLSDTHTAAKVDRALAFRRIQLPFTGDDLGVPPGRHVGQALRDTKLALFRGEVAIEEAKSFAADRALQYLRDTPMQRGE